MGFWDRIRAFFGFNAHAAVTPGVTTDGTPAVVTDSRFGNAHNEGAGRPYQAGQPVIYQPRLMGGNTPAINFSSFSSPSGSQDNVTRDIMVVSDPQRYAALVRELGQDPSFVPSAADRERWASSGTYSPESVAALGDRRVVRGLTDLFSTNSAEETAQMRAAKQETLSRYGLTLLSQDNHRTHDISTLGATDTPAETPITTGQTPRAAPIEVNFPWDSARLTRRERQKLDQQIALARQGQASPLYIAGHTDTSGPNAYNDRLSERRAQAVVNYLVENGYPRELLQTGAFGETQPKVNTGDGVRLHENRRAVITPGTGP